MEGLKVINVREISEGCGMSSCDFSDCIPALKELLGTQFHAERADDGDYAANYQTALAWSASYPQECGMVEAVIASAV